MDSFGMTVCTTTHNVKMTEHKCYIIHEEETKSFIDGIYRYDYIFIDGTFNQLRIECIDKKITEVPYLPDIKGHAPKTDNPYTISYKMLFEKCDKLTDITVLESLDMTNVTDLSYVFANCESLENIQPIINWNVSKIENMRNMFYSCFSLKDIRSLTNWDVSNVRDMREMFCNSWNIKEFSPISNWNVKRAERLDEMFNFTSISYYGSEVQNWRPRVNCNVYHFLDSQHDDIDNDSDVYKECPWIGICILYNQLGVTDIDCIPEDIYPASYIRQAIGKISPDLRSWIHDDHKLDIGERNPPLTKTANYEAKNEPLYSQIAGYSGGIILRNSSIQESEEFINRSLYYYGPSIRCIKLTDKDGKIYRLKEWYDGRTYIEK